MLLLPPPVSTNRYWRNFRGHMVRSKEAVEYKETVQHLAIEAGIQKIEDPSCVSVEIVVHPARPKDWERRIKRQGNSWVLSLRRQDLDNQTKVVLDALQGIAYDNDRQITSLHVHLGDAIEGGGLSVVVSEDITWGVAA